MRDERQIQLPSLRRLNKHLRLPTMFMSLKQSPAAEHDVSVPNKTNTLVNSSSALVSTANARTLRQACAERSRSAQDDTLTSVIIHGLGVLCAFPLRSLRLTHTLLLITILLITNNQIHAQSPYTGGPGDGHAMGELVLRNVSVNELSTSDGYLIYPALAKAGEAVYITSPVAGELQIIDLTGRIIHTQTIEQPVQQLPVIVTQAGLCIGIIRTQAGTYTQKLIVVE